MPITLDAELEAALSAAAERRGISIQELARSALRERFVPSGPLRLEPQDDWEQKLMRLGLPIGANLSDEALSREGIYD